MVRAVFTTWLPLITIAVFVADGIAQNAPVKPPNKAPATQPAPVTHPAGQAAAKPRVALDIRSRNEEWGRIVIELDPAKAPHTVANFLRYVDDGFYDNTVFHRVIKDFIIQGGAYTSPGQKKSGEVHDRIMCESRNGLKNLRGTIAAARGSKPHSATSQFFINVKDNPRLDHPGHDGWGYCVFGRVIEGMDVLDKIATTRTRVSPEDRRKYLMERRKDPQAARPESSQPFFPPVIVHATRIETPAAAEQAEPTRQVSATPPPAEDELIEDPNAFIEDDTSELEDVPEDLPAEDPADEPSPPMPDAHAEPEPDADGA